MLCFCHQVLLVYGLAFMVILPVVVVSPGNRLYDTEALPQIPLFSRFSLFVVLFCFVCIRVVGHVVVPLHQVQRRPDPHQHHPALHAFHVQDAQHEHEA